MAYREDEDLEFLKNCSTEDLDVVFTILTEENGTRRLTEDITYTEQYKKNAPDHTKYWDLIAAEIQCFGGNTFATMIRGGKGVLYREVLMDACDKMKVNYNKNASVATIEMNLLMKILTDSMEKMSQEELKEIVGELDLKTTNYSKEAIVAALQGSILLSGFMAYKISLIVANAIAKAMLGRGLSMAANVGLTRSLAVFAGPIGWALTALWTAIDIAGPAYRITIPGVIQIAFLRAKQQYAQ
jgi:uncharacterized protein YaaW (UPF0174 family)